MRLKACILLLTICCATTARVDSAQQPRRAPDVHWEPTPDDVVAEMLRLAQVKKGDIVYDLGCGDGRIVIAAARDFGARGVGIDIDPQRIRESVENAKAARVTNQVTFREDDLFEANIKEATVVTLFLWPSLNLKLKPRLLNELKPGTRVVSYIHSMGDWEPDRQIQVRGRPVYLWQIHERQDTTGTK